LNAAKNSRMGKNQSKISYQAMRAVHGMAQKPERGADKSAGLWVLVFG